MEASNGNQEILDWLASNGWSKGRDIADRAGELIRERVDASRRQGVELPAFVAAERIIRSYGLLHLERLGTSDSLLVMKPTVGYEGDVDDIEELRENLGLDVFPVGYDSGDFALVLVDVRGRFFSLHHTGAYFMGNDEFDAFRRFMRGLPDHDAEEYFV